MSTPSGVLVRLTNSEMYLSGEVGYRRNLESIITGRKPRFPERIPGELFGRHIIAAMAELAVSKLTGTYWGGHVKRFQGQGADVNGMEVRWSMRSDLKVRRSDKGIVVSVHGLPPSFFVIGWIEAEQAKQERWASENDPPCYFVPHAELNSTESLPCSGRIE